MARKIKQTKKRKLVQYEHKKKKRLNNPPVGLVTPQTDKDAPKKKYEYDPHLDPQLIWAGKAEHISFEVPTVSLHVHERIDSRTIIEAVRKKNGNGEKQLSLFALPEENLSLRDAIDFYKHKHNWSNRLIAGDSLLVMNSLLEKEGMRGKVQMIYMDPPYGIKYGSNFQPFVNKRDVKDGKDEDLTTEPEMIKAFRDTWELGIHSYLTYMRDRLLLARELLNESGSIFVQISDENVHLVRCLLDEVFGVKNFVSLISFVTTSGIPARTLSRAGDYILWYAKSKDKVKYRQLFSEKNITAEMKHYNLVRLKDGTVRRITRKEMEDISLLPEGSKLATSQSLTSQGETKSIQEVELEGKIFRPPSGQHWKTTVEGIKRLYGKGRILFAGNSIRYLRFADDFSAIPITNVWIDTVIGSQEKEYIVQTSVKTIQRCILMTTDPGDLVFDPTCGSGTTAYVAEQWGRRWITCDTSRVAIAIAKQRLMTAVFDYYKLAHPEEGVGSGFVYKTVPHITLKSIANNEPPKQETLYDQPYIDNSKARVTGPFTVEAVPSPTVKSLDELDKEDTASDVSVARSGETLRQAEWRDALLNSGVRGKGGQYIKFSRVEPLSGTRFIQAEAETIPEKDKDAQRVLVVFGPEHAPMDRRQVELALDEAQHLRPKADIILFCAFQFDPEAAKDIDEVNWPGVTLLRVQMNADLFTDDLKKKRSSADSFWLLGQPDVEVREITKGGNKGKLQVEVKGFDYYDTTTGLVRSGGKKDIAMWMLDTDYDGRSLFPRQVFFPLASDKEGWGKLAKNLKAEIDQELIKAYSGTISLPFSPGEYKQIAVKIIDTRGIESLKIIRVE